MSETVEPTWLKLDVVVAAHDVTIARHGGLPGIRDAAALESALSRALNKWHYGETDAVTLAAAYGFGLARNHAFSDGNKRIALIATITFLHQNGQRLRATQSERSAAFLSLAAGELDEEGLALWLREHAAPG